MSTRTVKSKIEKDVSLTESGIAEMLLITELNHFK
jgi:hypothetical protein